MEEPERPSEAARTVFARPAYAVSLRPAAECRDYAVTGCGRKNCCFECISRVSCKEFEGYCNTADRKTYRSCPERIHGSKQSGI